MEVACGVPLANGGMYSHFDGVTATLQPVVSDSAFFLCVMFWYLRYENVSSNHDVNRFNRILQ